LFENQPITSVFLDFAADTDNNVFLTCTVWTTLGAGAICILGAIERTMTPPELLVTKVAWVDVATWFMVVARLIGIIFCT
jgi:hypothetical protein